jgi:hypothetical protein
MLVITVQAAIPVRGIDDKIGALMLLLGLFYGILSFILVLCLGL